MAVKEVILVNESDEAIGAMEKMEAHRLGVLHRAFSVFIFNSNGHMLLQQRADTKYHSAGLWTNACCSHPAPGEELRSAAERRLQEELGFKADIKPAFDFIYKASFNNGLTEHEYDHVFVGYYDGEIRPDQDEVKGWKFVNMDDLAGEMEREPDTFTSWFQIAFPKLRSWLGKQNFQVK
jgi:isopentenyl-diphosphate delta-isomerase